ncbi:hypothetical protein I5Q34_06010 [Streptomyces sp. AV19]|uniref:hypothetical protein n=1 Tax=Streptomyces sp. AV19 TaxID=2793068 RepID=UPI0018FED31D|nr:hypothetical protein [Streptomyces sp. AV19]MBH1933852.1 hypothetical protein [Streptomyces sp. AV19]MDG4533204.1 hypothetical protein [Streptomyces sp. AV19]
MTATETGYPVPDRPVIRFTWLTGDWFEIFQKHVALIQSDIARAQAEDRMVVYLSCPISSRRGSHFRTNTEVANFVTRRLADRWGERFFVLNPTAYQLESKEGTGLIVRHISELARETGRDITLEALKAEAEPGGGDYMRMWTRVITEDGYLSDPPSGRGRRGRLLGGLFDAVYFLGPDDVHEFFDPAGGSGSLVRRVEEYFARKSAVDPEFWADFGTVRDGGGVRPLDLGDPADAALWEERRKDFVRNYTVRAGAGFSRGSHDEWNIFVRLNRLRVADPCYGAGEQVAFYFAGRGRGLAEGEGAVSPGYEVPVAAEG